MTKTLHEGAGEVIRLMRSLGMDEAMQARVLKELYVAESYADVPLEKMGYRKVSMDKVWTT
jgi:hypothetical protein